MQVRGLLGGCLVLVLVIIVSAINYFYLDPCRTDSYTCANSTQCIPLKYVCNDHADCPLGDDESSKNCVNMRGDLTLLASLGNILKDNEFHNESTICDLEWYPPECNCNNYTALFCLHLNLTEVPQNVSPNVTIMNLSHNLIELSNSSFSAFRLAFISLENNQLEHLKPGVFAGQVKLQRLMLMRNKLSELKAGDMSDLTQLRWLFLKFNQLQDVDLEFLRGKKKLNWLDLSHNRLTLSGTAFPRLEKLSTLSLQHNFIEEISNTLLRELPAITTIKLSNNRIHTIHKDAFQSSRTLRELILSDNLICTLDNGVFLGLNHLDKLSLDNNYKLDHVTSDLFVPLANLTSLNMEGVEIKDISIDLFKPLRSLIFLNLKNYYYCSYAPWIARCQPTTDGISSQEDLFDQNVIRVTVWLLAIVNLFGNSLVLRERIVSRDDNKILSLVIRNLAAADFLMGLYLVSIGSVDMYYRNTYHKESHTWMSSWACTFIGVLAMTSSEVSVLILVFMSLERFLLISFPFERAHTLTTTSAHITLALIWCAGLFVALVPVVYWCSSRGFYGTNSMCFPLHIDDPYFQGWEYSAFVFLGINLGSLTLIALLYTLMFVNIYRTRHATSIGGVGDVEIVFRFFFIVLTDALCWAPIIIMKFMALGRVVIPTHLYAWIVVFVLPVNSALNPLLYTFTTPKYLNKISWASAKKRFKLRRQSTPDTECSRSTSSRNMVFSVAPSTKIQVVDLEARKDRNERFVLDGIAMLRSQRM